MYSSKRTNIGIIIVVSFVLSIAIIAAIQGFGTSEKKSKGSVKTSNIKPSPKKPVSGSWGIIVSPWDGSNKYVPLDEALQKVKKSDPS